MAKQDTQLVDPVALGARDLALEVLKESGVDPTDPRSLSLVEQVLSEYVDDGSSVTLDQLYEIDFHRRPPSIEEFITDDYFLGQVCNADPEAGVTGLFQKWREALIRDFNYDSPVQQIVLSGAIGMGKSWFGAICMLYKVAYCLCLRDPVSYFGLSAASTITFSFFSVTQKQVEGGTFSDCVKFLRSSPFFREHLHETAANRKYADRRIELTNDIVIEAGSQVTEALGRNVLGSLVDEANFRREKDAAAAANELVEAIHRRILSRFRRGSRHPGLMVLISSAQNDTDFLSHYITQHRHDPTVRVYDFPWWEVAGPYKMEYVNEAGETIKGYSGKTFLVDTGDSIIPPRMIDDPTHAVDVSPNRLIQVPVEHRDEFERNLTGSIRDVAGVGTGRTSKLFPNIVNVFNCLDEEAENPFRTHSIPLSVDVDQTPIWDPVYLDRKRMLKWSDSRAIPMRHANAPRFIHLDMSTGALDALGIAMLHPIRLVEVTGFDKMTHRAMQLFKPVFELDFALRITRSPKHRDKPIDLGKIREFIGWLRNHSFRVEMVSCDMRELSTEMRSILSYNGFETDYLSVDKKKDPYYQFKQTVDEGRLRLFDHDYLFTEMTNLEDLEKKIDHPETFPPCMIDGIRMLDLRGSKDLADAVCGALFMATQSQTTVGNSDPRSRVEVLTGLNDQRPAEGWLLPEVVRDRHRIF